MNNITIGITKCASKYKFYQEWLCSNDTAISIKQLSYTDDNNTLKECNGILFTGGVDIHPKNYNSDCLDYENHPSDFKFDEKRDEFEIKIFKYARQNNIPVLAICRGLQLINAILGGDLIQNLDSSILNNHWNKEHKDVKHKINVIRGTLLCEIVLEKIDSGSVISAHHQAINKIADELIVNARSVEDDVIEGIEWKIKENNPWFLGVQWHPERMSDEDLESRFTNNIRERFIDECKKNHSNLVIKS